ncbi:RHS repeat-associated core domain-containing protein [Catenovulum maritimum]|nr:RHS repeat-associated core domain-containing protein [Catenovulum maritimum]
MSNDSSVEQGATTSKGYTGHEILGDNGLIHMNGRVYDPNIGRFLSAYILVQVPTNSQSYNRCTHTH